MGDLLHIESAEDFHFERDTHAYMVEEGRRQVMSVTQVIKHAGLISFDGIPPQILAHAQWRGTLVHECTQHWDQGTDPEEMFEIPQEVIPYYYAWLKFVRECDFVPFPDGIEVASVARVRGMEYGMTPDRRGLLRGIPTIVEIKNTAQAHPCWGVQLAGYEMGSPRPPRYRNWQRIAVQLKPDGTYKPHPFADEDDFAMFEHSYSVAAWKLNKRQIKISDPIVRLAA